MLNEYPVKKKSFRTPDTYSVVKSEQSRSGKIEKKKKKQKVERNKKNMNKGEKTYRDKLYLPPNYGTL